MAVFVFSGLQSAVMGFSYFLRNRRGNPVITLTKKYQDPNGKQETRGIAPGVVRIGIPGIQTVLRNVNTIEALCPQISGQDQQADKQMFHGEMMGHDKCGIVRDKIDKPALSQDRNQKLCNLQPEANSGYGSQQRQEGGFRLKICHGGIAGEGHIVSVDGKQDDIDHNGGGAYEQSTCFVKIPLQPIPEQNRQMIILQETRHFQKHNDILSAEICLRQGNGGSTENSKDDHCSDIIPMPAEYLTDEAVADNHGEQEGNEPGRIVESKGYAFRDHILYQIDGRDPADFQTGALAQQGGQQAVKNDPEQIGE